MLCFALLIGAAVRVYEFARTPLWDDEAITFFASSQGLRHLFEWLPRDPHPPLHYLLEAGMIRLLGNSELALRLPSLLAGILLIAVTGVFGTRLAGRVAGFWAAMGVAISPVLVFQSHNARCYSLLALVMLCAVWALWRYPSGGSWKQGVAAVSGGLISVYLHYLGGMLLVLGAAALLLQKRASRTINWLPVAVIALGSAPLALLISHQIAWMRSAGTERVTVFAAIKRAVHVLGPGPELDGPLKLPLCVLFVVGLLTLGTVIIRSAPDRRSAAMPATAAGIFLFLMFAFVSLHLWAIVDYHYAIVVPLLALLAGVAVSAAKPGRQRFAVAGLALAGPATGTLMTVLSPARPISDFVTARRLVENVPSDGIILPRLTDLYCYAYYGRKELPVSVLNTRSRVDALAGRQLLPATEIIGAARSVWVMSKGSENGLYGFEKMRLTLTEQGFQRTHAHRSAGLLAVRWERAHPNNGNGEGRKK